MCFRILHPIIEIAKRIVSCTCQIAGERKSRIAVSYTHLDVYKRQRLSLSIKQYYIMRLTLKEIIPISRIRIPAV